MIDKSKKKNDLPVLREYFALPELSEYSSISVDTLRDHIRRDGLPVFQPRGKILVRKSEFDKWMDDHRLVTVDDTIKELGL